MVHHALFGSYNVLLRSLAMTRSLGDVYLKKQPLPPEEQMVTAVPDITVHHLQSEDEFLVLASDGIIPSFFSISQTNVYRNLGLFQFTRSYQHHPISNFLGCNTHSGLCIHMQCLSYPHI